MFFSRRQAFVIFIALLALLLVGYFFPLSTTWRLSLGLIILITTGYILFYQNRHTSSHQPSTPFHLDKNLLPPVRYQGTLVLVSGEIAHSGWFADKPIRITPQGCYIQVANGQLAYYVEQLLYYHPEWRQQLVSLYLIAVEQQNDPQVFISQYQHYFDQLQQIEQRFHFSPAAILMAVMHDTHNASVPLWFTRQGQYDTVWQTEQLPQSLSRWLASVINQDHQQNYPQSAQLRYYYAQQRALYWHWFSQLQEKANIHTPWALTTLCFTPMPIVADNLWQQSLYQQSGLLPQHNSTSTAIPYPDQLLAALPKQNNSLYQLHRFRWPIISSLLFAALALTGSCWNNQQLLQHIASDVQQYQLVSKDLQLQQTALIQIEQDARQLNQWYQQGEPIKFSLGLYQGETLRLPLLNWLSQHAVKKRPAVTTLDLPSLGLFNPGEARLKPQAEKSLVNLLVQLSGYSAQQITIIGYTDNTGNPQINQRLSLERANAVRNWLMNMGHFPAHCLVTQGRGADNPIADNHTAEGRAKNRRVTLTVGKRCSKG